MVVGGEGGSGGWEEEDERDGWIVGLEQFLYYEFKE